MFGVREKGKAIYNAYKFLTITLSPLIKLHLHWRKLRGLEHRLRWSERLGHPSLPRPSGPLIWLHAVSLGEGMAAIPVIRRCIVQRPHFNILMTTTTFSAFKVLKNLLPPFVIYQFAPLDVPAAVDAFLGYWKPDAIILLESELWPNLIMAASESKIAITLINARMSERSFGRWSAAAVLPLITLMLSKFSLIVPLSTKEAIRFQLLQAPPFIVSFSADLKYGEHNLLSAVGECITSMVALEDAENLQIQFNDRQAWMASSVHKGEDEVMLRVHKTLVKIYPNILTIIVPRHPEHGIEFAQTLKKRGFNVAVRSDGRTLTPTSNIYVINTLGELREFYRLVPIAVIGGSFLPSLAGHNISEATAAGCAVLTGPHIGHFSHMVSAMQRVNPLSVLQVSGELELIESLQDILSNPIALEARQSAAKQAFHELSSGIVTHVWNQLNCLFSDRFPV